MVSKWLFQKNKCVQQPYGRSEKASPPQGGGDIGSAGSGWPRAAAAVRLLLLVVGIVPAGYAIYQSFLARSGSGFGGISAYHDVVTEFQFVGTLENIGLVMAVWLPFMIIGVVGLALLLHGRRSRLVGGLRFIYYLPGALAGMGKLRSWLFLLDPVDSPIRPLLSWLGYTTLDQTAEPAHLPVIFALMLFFQGAGTWILIIYGGLNGISDEVQEAAIVDGATGWQLTRRIKLPLIRPWIAYLILLNIAYATQLSSNPRSSGLPRRGPSRLNGHPTN